MFPNSTEIIKILNLIAMEYVHSIDWEGVNRIFDARNTRVDLFQDSTLTQQVDG